MRRSLNSGKTNTLIQLNFNQMKKILLLFSFITVTASCVATDLSDLDSLFINVYADKQLTFSTSEESQGTVTQSDTVTQSGTNQGQIDDSESAQAEDDCELMLCNTVNEFQEFYSEGDLFDFGMYQARLKSYHDFEDEEWTEWFDEQFGIRRSVKMARFEYLEQVEGKDVDIEMFYNSLEGDFVMGRIIFEKDYNDMRNNIVKKFYEEAREDFNPEIKYSDNTFSNYFDNADGVYYNIVYQLQGD